MDGTNESKLFAAYIDVDAAIELITPDDDSPDGETGR
jgi:hypothetical protein